MKYPLISIIIPVYNAQNLLHKCLNSVLNQTYKNFEVILVNDGSKDDSLSICKEWSLKDNRFITIDQENQGAGTARNTGFKVSKGEYVYFLDADDFINSDLLTKTINEIDSFKYDMVVFGFNKITVDGKNISTIRHKETDLINLQNQKEELARLFLDGGCFAVWDKIFKKDFLIKNNILFDKKKRGQDMTFMIKCFNCATALKSIPDVLHNYHVVYNATHKYDTYIIENHIENFMSLYNLFSVNNPKTISNSNLFLKRIFVLWFGIVVPMNIINNKQLDISVKKANLKKLYSQNEFQKWLVYLSEIKSSAKNEIIFKVTKTQNTTLIILFIKLLSFFKKENEFNILNLSYMKEKLYSILPDFFQNLMVTIYNIKAYKNRYGGEYKSFRKLFFDNRTISLNQLQKIQSERFEKFISHSITHSEYYKKLYENIKNPEKLENIKNLPIVSKEDLRKNINQTVISTGEKLMKAKTGGTTGKSLEVYVRAINAQERFAMLDDFRSRFGYELGKKTAWFSGKKILTKTDVKKNRFWKTDFYYNVRYYSTFHLKKEYLKFYVEDLLKYKPKYISGFPSSIYEVAKCGIANNYDFPENTVLGVFTTAETVTDEMRETIETFFKTKIYNQYASSEGAPFIFECVNGNLHLELQSGVFEVLDENNNTANSGRLVVTSFTTEATPLIRYDIGDMITIEDIHKKCGCGNHNPMIKELLGRIDDYVYSPENGKINIINIANAVKDVHGVINYRIVQNKLDEITLQILRDEKMYSTKEEQLFLKNWRDRVGEKMVIKIEYVNNFDVANSGKFRVVENNIKHLI